MASHCPKGKSSGLGNEKPSNAECGDKPKAKARAYNIVMKEAKDHPKNVSGPKVEKLIKEAKNMQNQEQMVKTEAQARAVPY
ncbi:hypothetical protein L1987_20863 [Smallanthus sonchifolius]|uniref:Uncharacterized protein n=1 Tax=Smallanthus sonchifolius TaxID=185202 RepID=A0ACB9ITJ0_9ASTR|nr:hypothetical protein L1987_20863 [Smallanthus sonchifolius]